VDYLSTLGTWISENEALLSGIAAMIVVAGVIFTPFGAGVRRILGQEGSSETSPPQPPSQNVSDSPVQPSVPAAPADRPSIAVLPLSNMSADEEQEYLADGMTEDLITGLAANRHLYVVSRNSTFAYKGQSPDIRQVGRDLGVRYVLEGSLRRVGESLRTTVQLIDSADGNHLWAEKYDRAASEMSQSQDEVVGEIAGALSLQINAAERKRSKGEATHGLSTWDLVQRGLSYAAYSSPSIETIQKGQAILKSAVELDPNDGFARACYAWILFSSAINGWTTDPRQALTEGESQLNAALDSGLEDPLTFYYVGCAYVYSGRHERAIRFLEESLNLNPHQPDARLHLALATAYCGDFAKAHALFDQTGEADGGLAYRWYPGIVLCLEEKYEEAIAVIEPLVDQIPRYATARVTLAIAYEGMGRPAEAEAEVIRAAQLDPGLCLDGIALNIAAHPDPEKGRQRQALLRRYWPTNPST
jgi:TolB-like protein/Tfp pilus assembly protein PilF